MSWRCASWMTLLGWWWGKREHDCLPVCCLSGVVPSFPARFQIKFGRLVLREKGLLHVIMIRVSLLERYDFFNAVQRLGPSHVY
jgi:hypothetical protein